VANGLLKVKAVIAMVKGGEISAMQGEKCQCA
jgi:hypothetical protein